MCSDLIINPTSGSFDNRAVDSIRSVCHFSPLRLLSAVLRTSEVESRATRASLTELLSPQMGKDIVWFLRRWAKTYLLVDEKLYGQVRWHSLSLIILRRY